MPEILAAQNLEKLEIKKPMQGIVSTSMLQDGNGTMYIKEGSILYSGVTGEQVGTLKSRLKFPFERQKLIENLLKRKIHVSSDKDLRGSGLDIPFNEIVKFFHLQPFQVFQNAD